MSIKYTEINKNTLYNMSLYDLPLIMDCRKVEDYKRHFICGARNVDLDDSIEDIYEKIMDFCPDNINTIIIVLPKNENIFPLVMSTFNKDNIREYTGFNVSETFILHYEEHENFVSSFPFLSSFYEDGDLVEELFEKSIEKLVPYPSIIIDTNFKLFIGNADNARNVKVLKNLGITHVVNVTKNIGNYSQDIEYLNVPVDDDESENIIQYMQISNEFINNAISQNGRILVHCNKGCSRSVTIVIGFLCTMFHLSVSDSLYFIRRCRKNARPNNGFLRQLEDLFM